MKSHQFPVAPRESSQIHTSDEITSNAAIAASTWLDRQLLPSCLLDNRGKLLGLNAAWQAIAKMTRTDMVDDWLDLFQSTDRSSARSQLNAAIESVEVLNFECRLLTGDGNSRWHQLRLQSIDGTWICIATDIELLKAKENELLSLARIQTEMLNVGPDCIKLIAGDGKLIHANRAGCQALGIAENSALGMLWLELLPEEVRPLGESALDRVRRGLAARFPGRSVLPGKTPQYWDNILTPITDKSGNSDAILCISREVTEEYKVQESLRQSQHRLAMAASVGGLGVWDYDIKNDILTCDDVWYRIMGRNRTQPINSIAQFRPIIHPEDVDRATEVDAAVASILASQGQYKIEFRVIHPSGDVRWIRSVAALMQEDHVDSTRAIGFVVDITDARRGELILREANHTLELEKQALTRQSMEDPLTGLANRRVLDAGFERLYEEAIAAGEVLAVAMIDVDYFKSYNDRYGHLKGDDALKGVSKALASIARRTDLVARFGGEEFVAIFPCMDDPTPMLQRLMDAVATLRIEHGASPLGWVTVSCGCVVVRASREMTPSDVLAAGDTALYDAKRLGRNQFTITRI